MAADDSFSDEALIMQWYASFDAGDPDRAPCLILYKRYDPVARREIKSILGPAGASGNDDDIINECWVNALTIDPARRYDFRKGNFRPWFLRVLHNACVSHGRREGRRLRALRDFFESLNRRPSNRRPSHAWSQDDLAKLRDCLNTLDDQSRIIVILYIKHELTLEDIAELLKIKLTQVWRLKKKALGDLLDCVGALPEASSGETAGEQES